MHPTEVIVKVTSLTTAAKALDDWVEEARHEHMRAARMSVQRLPLEGPEGQWTIGVASVDGRDYVIYVHLDEVMAHRTMPRTVRARMAAPGDYVHFRPVATAVQIQFTLDSPTSDRECDGLAQALLDWFGTLTAVLKDQPKLQTQQDAQATRIYLTVSEQLLSGEEIAVRARNLISSTLTDSPRLMGDWDYIRLVAMSLLTTRHWPPRRITVTGGLLR